MKFEELVKNDKYQVFLFTCPAGVPLNFARHPWFVINKMRSVERWEVFRIPDSYAESWGHLHRNALPPTQGIPVFSQSKYPKHFWKGKLRGYIEGGEGSLAQTMTEFIESTPNTYPYCNTYGIKGPNINTYVQWVLNKFPNSGLSLPWNSFGKNYNDGK